MPEDENNIQSFDKKYTTPDLPLKSYNLKSEKQVDILLEKYKKQMFFFMGYEESGHRLIADLHMLSLGFFMEAKLIPRFRLYKNQLAGNYMVYRKGSDSFLMGRPVSVSSDGRVVLKFERDGKLQKFFGRCHLFDENKLVFTIDRKIDGEKTPSHRSHYMFYLGTHVDPHSVGRIYGASAILSQHNNIRIGEEILVPLAEKDFDAISPIDINTAKPEEYKKMTAIEREIFEYLKDSTIKLVNTPTTLKVNL